MARVDPIKFSHEPDNISSLRLYQNLKRRFASQRVCVRAERKAGEPKAKGS
jgi:hypothetical protein